MPRSPSPGDMKMRERKNASDMKMKPFKWTFGRSKHPQAPWNPHAVSVDRLLRCGCGGVRSENTQFHVNDGSLLHQQLQQKQFKIRASPLVSLKSLKSTPFLFFFSFVFLPAAFWIDCSVTRETFHPPATRPRYRIPQCTCPGWALLQHQSEEDMGGAWDVKQQPRIGAAKKKKKK